MAVCTLTLSSASEGPFLLLLQAAGISALLLRVLRIWAFALDSSVPLYPCLLFLLWLVSQSLSLIICSPLVGLLGRRETTKVGSSDVANRIYSLDKIKGGGCLIFEHGLHQTLVYRFLPNTISHGQVGDENDRGQRGAYHLFGDGPEVVHPLGKLRAGIREVEPVVLDVLEMFQ